MWQLICFIVYIKSTISMVTNVDAYQLSSPCPDTFQYQNDEHGQLYGTIGVYSLDDNVVQLNVELSLGTHYDNYNGEILLMTSKAQAATDLTQGKPIRYKIHFPRWQGVPPRVIKILVNNQEVCSGPPLPYGRTKVNLQHRLRRTNSLSAELPPVKRFGFNNPFLNNDHNSEIFQHELTVPKGFNVKFQPETPQDPSLVYNNNPFFSTQHHINYNQRPDNFNTIVTLGTSTTTTERSQFIPGPFPPKDITISRNPFSNNRENSKPQAVPDSPETQLYSNVCGRPVLSNPLVLKGQTVPRGSFPWLAAMFHSNGRDLEYKCSGTLISHRHIVTAAHCVKMERKRLRPEDILFILGKLNIKAWPIQNGEKMVAAERIHVHPDYIARKSDADIAIALLTEDVIFSSLIRPICLWTESDDLNLVVGQSGTVVAWGKEEDDGSMTGEPKQTTVPIVSQEVCLRSSETFQEVVSGRTFCAGRRDGSGPCNGDSGTGFIMERNGRWMLRGIVSVSVFDSNRQTCDLFNFVVFVDVSKHTDWLFRYLRQ